MARRDGETENGFVEGLLENTHPPHGAAFGRFIAVADRIVDDPLLVAGEKAARLEALGAILEGRAPHSPWAEITDSAQGLRASLQVTGVSSSHALSVLKACRRDSAGIPNRTWQELLAYCQVAAAPVGRHLLALAGEKAERAGPAADALCAGVLILLRIRHWHVPGYPFHRLCIPADYLRDAAVSVERLHEQPLRGQTRAVIDRMLDGVDRLLEDAAPLPGLIAGNDLCRTSALTLCLVSRLSDRLKTANRGPVRLGFWDFRLCTCRCWIRHGGFRRRRRLIGGLGVPFYAVTCRTRVRTRDGWVEE